MKPSLTPIILLLFLQYGHSQMFQLSKPFPDQNNLWPHTTLALKDGTFLAVKSKNLFTNRGNTLLDLIHLDKNMELINSKTLDLEENDQFLEKIVYLRDTVFCLIGNMSDIYGLSSLNAHALGLNELELSEVAYPIFEYKSHAKSPKYKIDEARQRGQLTQYYVNSNSQAYIALINYDQLIHQKDGLVSFMILNDQFELLEKGLIDLEPGKNYSKIRDIQFFLTDQAELLLYFKAKDQITQENSSFLIKLSGSGTIQKQRLDVADGELYSVQFFPSQTDKQFFITGLYTSGANKFEGVALYKIEPKKLEKTEASFAKFPKGLLPRKNRKYSFAKAYQLLEIIPKSDNSLIFVAEHYRKVKKTYNGPALHYNGQIILGHLNQRGKFSWTHTVEKFQRSVRQTLTGTAVVWDQSNEKAHLLFNYTELKSDGDYHYEYYEPVYKIGHLSIDSSGDFQNYPSINGHRLMNYGNKGNSLDKNYISLVNEEDILLFCKTAVDGM